MNPQIMIDAETLAQHFCRTRRTVGSALGKSYPTWEFTHGKERKVLIETFKIILLASSEVSKQQNMSVKTNLR